MHSSCSISSTADGTCQKCFTKHRDGWDKTQCSWRFVDADCIGLFYLSVNIVLLFSGKELPVSADEARTLLAPDAAVSIFSDAAESPPPLLSNDEADRVKRRQEWWERFLRRRRTIQESRARSRFNFFVCEIKLFIWIAYAPVLFPCWNASFPWPEKRPLHCISSTHSWYFVEFFLGSSLGLLADTVATYCPSKPSQLTQKNST